MNDRAVVLAWLAWRDRYEARRREERRAAINAGWWIIPHARREP